VLTLIEVGRLGERAEDVAAGTRQVNRAVVRRSTLVGSANQLKVP
jgi:hypothetical protein